MPNGNPLTAEEIEDFLRTFRALVLKLQQLLDHERPLTAEEAAKYLQVHVGHLRKLRNERPPLPCHSISVDGSKKVEVRYFRREIDEWLEDRISPEESARRKARWVVETPVGRRRRKK